MVKGFFFEAEAPFLVCVCVCESTLESFWKGHKLDIATSAVLQKCTVLFHLMV